MKIKNVQISKYIKKLAGVNKKYSVDKKQAIYRVGSIPFAILEVKNEPPKISLRCHLDLARILIEKYEEVMPGTNLDPEEWISIVASGQLSITEIEDLILNSYNLASKILES